MDFALRIIFSGLLTFVPVDTNGDGRHDSAWVLFVDARVPNPPRDGLLQLFEAHVPAVRVMRTNVDAGGRQPPAWLGAGSEQYGIIALDEEDLTIVTTGSPSAFELVTGKRPVGGDGKPKALPCCTDSVFDPCRTEPDTARRCHGHSVPDSEQMRDFQWLASLSELVPAARLRGSLLNPTPGPAGLLAARLKVGVGRLESALLAGIADATPQPERYQLAVLVKFDSLPPATRRAVARRLVLTIGGLKTKVSLVSKRFGGATPAFPDLVLAPDAGCTANCIVTIHMFDSMLSEIHEPDQVHVHTGSKRHFELLWNLVDNFSGTRLAPSPVTGPDDDLICPSARP